MNSKEIEQAAQLFHSTFVVIEGNSHIVLNTHEKRIRWIHQFSETYDTNLKQSYTYKIASSKSLSETLKFSMLKLTHRNKLDNKGNPLKKRYTVSSDEKGCLKIMVIVLYE